MFMIQVRVPNMDCDGCASKLKKALLNLKGVEEVEIEMELQKITVRGYRLEEKKVMKAIKRKGKAAEPWPFPFSGAGAHHSHYANSFYRYPTHVLHHYYRVYNNNNNTSSTTSGSSSVAIPNTDNAGNSVHAFFHTPSLYSVAVAPDEAVASLFSDDNPHACTVM